MPSATRGRRSIETSRERPGHAGRAVRTVVATPFTPTLDSGRARRTYGIVSALAKHGPVDVVFGAFGGPAPDPAYRERPGVKLHRVDRPGAAARVPAYLRARAAGVPGELARGVWPG